jgi:hypothetical protein
MKTTKSLILALIISLISTNVMPKSFTKTEIRAYNISIISKMISAVQPELSTKKRQEISLALYQTAKKFQIDPKVMVAIISTESGFDNSVVSVSGDLSLAQINTKIWDVEFIRLGLGKINKKLLKGNEAYALDKMGKILSLLKKRHAKKDAKWYAIYHSRTKKFKNQYDGKIQERFRMIASIDH